MTDVRVGLIGATGLVGTEMLRILEERSFPVAELRVFASARSVGRKLAFAGSEVACEVLRDGCFDGLDLVVVDVDDPLALEWVPRGSRRARASSTTRLHSGWIPRCRSSWPRSTPTTCASSRRASSRARTAPRWCCSPRSRRCTARPGSSGWSLPATSRCQARGSPGSTSSTASGPRVPDGPRRCAGQARRAPSSRARSGTARSQGT